MNLPGRNMGMMLLIMTITIFGVGVTTGSSIAHNESQSLADAQQKVGAI